MPSDLLRRTNAPMTWPLLGLLLCSVSVQAAAAPCDQDTATETNCTCDLHKLHPLQGAVGMAEVREKAAKIEAKPEKEFKNLAGDPIKVVSGPGGSLYVIDHHHGALALLLAGYTEGICSIQGRMSPDPAQFWDELKASNKVHLEDQYGKPIEPGKLPAGLLLLPDDPYRSLAGMARQAGGYCRSLMSQKEFAEFSWADWLRNRPELPAQKVAADPAGALPVALTLMKSPAAADQPGYRGNKPDSFTCPKDD